MIGREGGLGGDSKSTFCFLKKKKPRKQRREKKDKRNKMKEFWNSKLIIVETRGIC